MLSPSLPQFRLDGCRGPGRHSFDPASGGRSGGKMGPDRGYGQSGSASRGILLPLVIVSVVVGGLSIGARRAFMGDRSREGAMTLNGDAYESRLGDPVAYVQEYEAGFSTSRRCAVLYPLRMPGALRHPGIEIDIDPE